MNFKPANIPSNDALRVKAVQRTGCCLMNLPRYMYKRYTPKGDRTFRFSPPRQLIDSGIVSRKELGKDFNEAKKVADENNIKTESISISQMNAGMPLNKREGGLIIRTLG